MGQAVEKRDPEVKSPGRDLISTPKHRGFGGNKQPLPIKSVGEIIEEAGETVPWVVEGILARGCLTDFAGQAKKGGKTTFWCHAIAAGARGEHHAGLHVEPAKYLYLTEQGNNFAGPLEDSGLDEHEEYVKVVRFKDVAGLKWNELMERAGEEVERLGLDALIVDTFAVFSGLKGSEENESGPVGDRMRVLRLVAQKHNIAVCLIRHSGKDGKPRGSSAFEAEADICVVLSRPEGKHAPGVRKLEVIGRYGEWERNIELKDGRYVSLGTDNKIEFGKAVRFIKRILPRETDAGLKKKEILGKRSRDDEEISASTLDRALAWLVEQGELGTEQLRNEQGKPKIYWLIGEAPGERNGEGIVSSHQTSSAGVEDKPETQEEMLSVAGEDTGVTVEESGLKPEAVAASEYVRL